MPPTPGVDPRIDLASWLALRDQEGAADAVGSHLRARLATQGVRPYAGAPDAGGNLVVRMPGRSPSLRPLVLLARTDLLDPAALAGLAAAVTVPSLLADAGLERDVILVLADDAPRHDASRPDADRGAPHAGRAPPERRPGTRDWFERQRRHDVKVVIVVGRLRPARWTPPGADVLRVAGVETDARMPGVLEDAAPPGCRLLLTRHGDDALPFGAHALPYLVVGDADPVAADDAPTPPPPMRTAAEAPPAMAATSDADLERLASHAARLAANLVARLDGARLPGPYGGYDSLEQELAAFGDAFGNAVGDALGALPLTREDLERRIEAIWG